MAVARFGLKIVAFTLEYFGFWSVTFV